MAISAWISITFDHTSRVVVALGGRGTLAGMDEATPAIEVSSTPPVRFRRTRIAVSIFFGILTLALCVLWVRSFWCYDSIWREQFDYLELSSNGGYVNLSYITSWDFPHQQASWGSWSSGVRFRPFGIRYARGIGFFGVTLPYWLLALAFASCGTLLLTRFQFGLRKLLFGMTLVAVALGLEVWLGR